MRERRQKAKLDNIAVILDKPKYPENIGSVARCARNMGVPKIICVNPLNPDQEKMLKMATHEAAQLIEGMEIHSTLESALAPFNFIIGTTARLGRHRQALKSPRELAGEIVVLSQKNKVGILFGPENTGLSNDELRLCHTVTTIDTADFSSLNVSQAVMVMLYEIFTASVERQSGGNSQARIATFEELQGMYADLREALLTIGFLKAENQEYGLDQVRSFLSRMRLLSRETQLIRGLCRQFKWYNNK